MPTSDTPPAGALGLGLGPVSIGWEDLRRHGLVSGVTGSGKTNTARLLANGLSACGVSVLVFDVKGDFAGIARPRQAEQSGGSGQGPARSPLIQLWDLGGEKGQRLRLNRPAPNRPQWLSHDLIATDVVGAGCINILSADDLIKTGATYAKLVLDLLELISEEPAQAETAKPQLVLLIEEAHLLFREAPEAQLLQALRASRDAGVAVVFITPDPGDPPPRIAAEFGVWIQHAIWTFSDAALRALQQRFSEDDRARLKERVRGLGIGEALVRTSSDATLSLIRLPRTVGSFEPLTPGERRSLVAQQTAVRAGQAFTGSLRRPRTRRVARRPDGSPRRG